MFDLASGWHSCQESIIASRSAPCSHGSKAHRSRARTQLVSRLVHCGDSVAPRHPKLRPRDTTYKYTTPPVVSATVTTLPLALCANTTRPNAPGEAGCESQVSMVKSDASELVKTGGNGNVTRSLLPSKCSAFSARAVPATAAHAQASAKNSLRIKSPVPIHDRTRIALRHKNRMRFQLLPAT